MAKQFFPNVGQVFTLLFSELPAGVYAEDLADDSDFEKRSYSSTELRAHSQMLADLYENLYDINRDKFVTTATTAGLAKWEKELFAEIQDATLSDEVRRNKLFAKIRSANGINFPTIYKIVQSILGALDFDILPYSGQHNGAWILDESSLGLNTWLSNIDPLYGYLLDNDLDYAAAGITQQQMIDMQEVAYKYEVRIYGNADAPTLALLDSQLTKYEPARSTHVIRNNQVRPVI